MLPQLYGEVELDLAAAGLIPDLDFALEHRTWQYIRSAIERLLGADYRSSWVQKEVEREGRRDHVRPAPRGSAGLREGRS